MDAIVGLLAANRRRVVGRAAVASKYPARHLAIVTCMDCRIDVAEVFDLAPGDAHVLRNAGGRVTDDVLRSLAVSTHVLGVATVALVQHTDCGLAGGTDEQLRAVIGADLGFLAFADHATALAVDIQRLAAAPFLAPLTQVAGLVYDVDSGLVEEVARWQR